ncbi:integrase arm-type DNA-binding domain-containing protein [Methylopila sp. 73B]|uniref:tyrosine-type recombinase/integrase n=1 Tax=Methylopila sp. 73B TaxID=1120792 RepID=UPI00036552C0|nr:integrase arm-type DNA-binding domain-containing protein [Methylopila sp. 73B]
MPLTDVQIRKAKAAEKPYKLNDGAGLHLYVSTAGGKSWRYRYEVGGKEKLLTIGSYPDVSLAEARDARAAARAAVKAGRDPSAEKREVAAAAEPVANPSETFEVIAREWHTLNAGRWTETHASDVLVSLERDVFPDLGEKALPEIGAPTLLTTLRKIEARGAKETARRVRQRVSAVFGFAIASGRATHDPAAQVEKAMAPLPKKGRQPAVTDLDEARQVLRDADATPAHPVTKLALRILALTALRPGELRGAAWGELRLEGDDPQWVVPGPRMKMKVEHVVPLSMQAVEALKVLRSQTGRGAFLFPNDRHVSKPMSENAIGYLLNRAGYHGRHVPHGWRAAFSTIMNERFKADRQIIDLMLAHAPKDKVEKAYNRAEHMDRRRELAQIWADLLMVDQAPLSEIFEGARR